MFIDSDSALVRSWIEGVSLHDAIQASVTITPTSAVAIILEVSALLQNIHQYIRKNKILFMAASVQSHYHYPKRKISLIGLGKSEQQHHFTSPEQAQQAFLDWRTNQWSLGALLPIFIDKNKPYGDKTNPFGATKTYISHI